MWCLPGRKHADLRQKTTAPAYIAWLRHSSFVTGALTATHCWCSTIKTLSSRISAHNCYIWYWHVWKTNRKQSINLEIELFMWGKGRQASSAIVLLCSKDNHTATCTPLCTRTMINRQGYEPDLRSVDSNLLFVLEPGENPWIKSSIWIIRQFKKRISFDNKVACMRMVWPHQMSTNNPGVLDCMDWCRKALFKATTLKSIPCALGDKWQITPTFKTRYLLRPWYTHPLTQLYLSNWFAL